MNGATLSQAMGEPSIAAEICASNLAIKKDVNNAMATICVVAMFKR
jgi:hypothetical protein